MEADVSPLMKVKLVIIIIKYDYAQPDYYETAKQQQNSETTYPNLTPTPKPIPNPILTPNQDKN